MLLGGLGVTPPSGRFGEFGTVSLRVEGKEINQFKEFSIHSHFLTPSDSFRFVVGDENLTDEVRKQILIGAKVEIVIDDAKQMTGYIYVVDTTTDRNGGTVITIEGRDTMSPVVDSQIDPDHHYPDKTPLDKLIRDVLEPFGFTNFEISNEANVDVAANRALKQKRAVGHKSHRRHTGAAKALKQYPVPKSKPQHNDSFFVFLSRIVNRYGLWIWPSVDGDTAIVGKPNYDQDPMGQLRRRRDGKDNNIAHGGIRIDGSEQPLFIVARGNIPPRHVEHAKMRVIIDNPYVSDIDSIVNTPNGPVAKILQLSGTTDSTPNADLQGVESARKNFFSPNGQLATSGEVGTFNSLLTNAHTEKFTWTTVIKSQPVTIPNQFAPMRVARPRFMRDKDSRTVEELTNFAKRQMSLCTRKAFCAKYTIAGMKLNGENVQVDTIIAVDDELSGFNGNLWVQGRTITMSRHGGTTTELDLLPIGAIQF